MGDIFNLWVDLYQRHFLFEIGGVSGEKLGNRHQSFLLFILFGLFFSNNI